jgi:hypothetical protein
MVRQPEQYQYSSHRCYLGLEPAGIVDAEPVLRHCGAKKKVARERYRDFVRAGMKLGHRDDFIVLRMVASWAVRSLWMARFIASVIRRPLASLMVSSGQCIRRVSMPKP